MKYSLFEKIYLNPIFLYWGYVRTIHQLPKLSDLTIIFRLYKKEYFFIITFLTFFLKCLFLYQLIEFQISYNNLFLILNIKKKAFDFSFFIYFFKFLIINPIQGVNIKKIHSKIGLKNEGRLKFIVTKIFLFFSEIFNSILLYCKLYNNLLIQIYNLFQNIFYSSKGFSLTFFLILKFFIHKNENKNFSKYTQFYI